jgi:hypothetical protein
VVRQARDTFAGVQAEDGPIATLTTGLHQTMTDAQTAMAAFAENMEALKRNFLLRGYFNDRGYFNLAEISPAAYREGVLTAGGERRPARVWLRADVIFEGDMLSIEGQARLDSAVASFLDRISEGVLMVEGYAPAGSRDEQYLASRQRAVRVRDYLVGKFSLNPQTTGVMPLGGQSVDSPAGDSWDGVALALFLESPRRE